MNKPRRKKAPSITRVTYSLPAPLAADIRRLSLRLKVSQSAFIAEMLKDAIAAMVDIISEIPEQGATKQDLKRATGRSREYIETIVEEAKQLAAHEALK